MVFTLAPETGEGFFSIERFHALALEVVVAAVKRFAYLSQFFQVSGHCVFDEVVRSTASFGGQLLQSGFGLRPEVYFHMVSLERSGGCVKKSLTSVRGIPPLQEAQGWGTGETRSFSRHKQK